jgi:hypothetical protein
VATALVLSPIAIPSWGQSKLVQVEDPFPAVDCTVYDTGNHVTDKHSQACRSFVQLARAKDSSLPLHIGPIYACFQINDELLVVDTAIDQATSDNKEWAALARPSFAFYRSGIENGLSKFADPAFMDGKWDPLQSQMGIANYSGTTDNDMVKEFEKLNKIAIPHFVLAITPSSIDLWDWTIQSSTGRFRYWTPSDDPTFGNNSVQLTGQCAIFKRDFKMESSPKANVQHNFWKQIN